MYKRSTRITSITIFKYYSKINPNFFLFFVFYLSSYIINSTIPETKQPESKPIEIIENSNSTGIISSIHKRLNQPQKEIIEITDSLNEGEVLENTDSMPLVSNELYNAVILPLLSSYSSHYLQFNLVKD